MAMAKGCWAVALYCQLLWPSRQGGPYIFGTAVGPLPLSTATLINYRGWCLL